MKKLSIHRTEISYLFVYRKWWYQIQRALPFSPFIESCFLTEDRETTVEPLLKGSSPERPPVYNSHFFSGQSIH